MKTIGILAYGSLLVEPGQEIEAVLSSRKENVITPFKIEFARSSRSRNNGPTLIPTETRGQQVSAQILVLHQGLDEEEARNILWRRETWQLGSKKKYPNKQNPGINDVIIERLDNFQGIDVVFYSKIAPNIEPLTPQKLAELAINSAQLDFISRNLDGVSYLQQVKNNGIKTPLMGAYEKEILTQLLTEDLNDALSKLFLNRLKEKGAIPQDSDLKRLRVIMETSSYVHCLSGLKVGKGWLSFILPKYALLSDELHHFGKPPEGNLLSNSPYAKLVEATQAVFLLSKKFPLPTEEQLEDLGKAFGDEIPGEASEYSYLGTMALLEYTKIVKGYLYVLPGLREDFINFCLKNKPDFLQDMKNSFLLCSVIDFLFEEEIPAFDPIQSATSSKQFTDFKEDFQKGVLSYAEKFIGSYELSDEQKSYLKETLANDEQRLLEFMQPENLKKCNISKATILSDALGLILPLPIGTLIEIGKEIRRVEAFENANLNFSLSLTILKKITNVGKIERSINCAVCAISPAEIEKMTDEQCDKIMYSDNLCLAHLIARLDLKKRFHLSGKDRLREMKRLGDASLWINAKDE